MRDETNSLALPLESVAHHRFSIAAKCSMAAQRVMAAQHVMGAQHAGGPSTSFGRGEWRTGKEPRRIPMGALLKSWVASYLIYHG